MRGYTYFKATDEYFNNLFSERGILFTDSDKKGLIGVWAKYNIKHRKMLGVFPVRGQHDFTFIYEYSNEIYTVKLGLEFFLSHGKEGVKKFNEIGINNLMLDLKLKDIPATIYKAIKTLNDIKFSFLTVHGLGGVVVPPPALADGRPQEQEAPRGHRAGDRGRALPGPRRRRAEKK